MNDIETNEVTFSENEEVPLTKSKGGRPKKEVLPKEKKPRTEKQIEAMKKAFETRKANIEQKKLEKKIEASKLLLQHGITPTPQNTPAVKPKTKKQQVVEESEESSEEEIIIKTVKKPKKKKIVKVEVSDSDTSSESEVDKRKPHSSSQFRKQQYQKPSSVIKVHDNKPKYYFAD